MYIWCVCVCVCVCMCVCASGGETHQLSHVTCALSLLKGYIHILCVYVCIFCVCVCVCEYQEGRHTSYPTSYLPYRSSKAKSKLCSSGSSCARSIAISMCKNIVSHTLLKGQVVLQWQFVCEVNKEFPYVNYRL